MTELKPYPEYKDSGVEWIGEVPNGWKVLKLKYLATIKNKRNTKKDLPYLGLENIESKTGKIISVSDEDIEGQSLYFEKNAVLFGKLRPYLTKVVKADFEGHCSTEFIVLEADQIEAQLLKYLMLSPPFISHVNSSTYGTKMPRASWEFIKNIYMPVSESLEQKKIVCFLNDKLEEVDYLIKKKEYLIKLLGEKRQAVITETVTKGLDPNVKMKDSGIDWIGEIPEHWEIKPLFSKLDEVKFKNKDLQEDNVLSLSYGRIIRREVSTNFGLIPASFESYNIVNEGNIVMRLTDLQNDKRSLRVGYVNERGIITSAYTTLSLNQDETVNSKYYYYLLHSYDLRKIYYGLGDGVRQTMSYADLKWLPLIIPPQEESSQIVKILNLFNENIDLIIDKTKKQVSKLKEYRESLIYEAVTGKIDLRDYECDEEISEV